MYIYYFIYILYHIIRSEYVFKFSDKFEMHDDAEVLKRMGLLFGELLEIYNFF